MIVQRLFVSLSSFCYEYCDLCRTVDNLVVDFHRFCRFSHHLMFHITTVQYCPPVAQSSASPGRRIEGDEKMHESRWVQRRDRQRTPISLAENRFEDYDDFHLYAFYCCSAISIERVAIWVSCHHLIRHRPWAYSPAYAIAYAISCSMRAISHVTLTFICRVSHSSSNIATFLLY